MSVYVYLSIDEIRERGACGGGIALFQRIAELRGKRRKIRVAWGPLAYLWLESVHPGFGYWLFANGLVPMPSLDGANLVGANLARASLVGASLVGANLARASLDGANLDGANLVGASLVGATMSVGAPVPTGYRGEPSRRSRCGGTVGCCMEDCLVLVREAP